MPEKLTQKEVDDLLEALADGPVVSFSEEKAKMVNINIVRKDIWPIPHEARECPVCGECARHYSLENKYEAPHLRYPQAIIDKDYFIQRYSTFTCRECQAIWQYLGEKKEEKE